MTKYGDGQTEIYCYLYVILKEKCKTDIQSLRHLSTVNILIFVVERKARKMVSGKLIVNTIILQYNLS